MMGLLSRGSVQSYFYLFEGLGINSRGARAAFEEGLEVMRAIEGKFKLVGYSLKEIRAAFEHELIRVRGLDIELVTDEAMTRADLINAVFLWYMAQPAGQREVIVRAGSEDFRRRRGSDEPLPLLLPGGIGA
jgi:hypothetical protein